MVGIEFSLAAAGLSLAPSLPRTRRVALARSLRSSSLVKQESLPATYFFREGIFQKSCLRKERQFRETRCTFPVSKVLPTCAPWTLLDGALVAGRMFVTQQSFLMKLLFLYIQYSETSLSSTVERKAAYYSQAVSH